MNKLTFTLVFLVLAFIANSQIAVLKGIITEENSDQPLIAATVTIGEEGVITDLDGSYEIALPEGTYDLEVSYVGYTPFNQSVTLANGETKILNIALSESTNLLNTATVTSGKHEVALGEVTISLDVIKPSLVESTNQNSLDGLLDKVPGVNMIGDQANIRGGSGFSYGAGSRVLLLIDDIPIYQADAGFPQWEDVPLENVEQIEVVKGAASALYGSSALNGIINVRTAYAKAKPSTYIAPYFITHSSPRNEKLKWWDKTPYTTGVNVAHRQKFGKLDLVLGGVYYHSNSVQDSSFSRRGRLSVNARYRLSDRLSIGVNSNFNKAKGASFFYWQGIDNLYEPGVEINSSENLRYNIDPFVTYFDHSKNRHKLMGRFFSVNNQNGTSVNDQSNISDVYYGEYQFQKKVENIGLTLTAGGVYIGSKVRAPLYGDTTFTSRNLAAYIQFDKKFFEKLTISAGFRYEDNALTVPEVLSYEIGGETVTGQFNNGVIEESKPVARFGLSYEAAKATYIRASWGQGYRFPTIAEKFITTSFGGVPVTPNYDLFSETGWSAELGVKQGFKVSEFMGYFDFSIFQMEYNDMMEFALGRGLSFQSQNIGDTKIQGFEASVTGRGNLFGLQTTLLTGYTYIDPKFKNFDPNGEIGSEELFNAQNSSICNQPNDPDGELCENILKYRSKHNLKFDIESKYKRFTLGFSANFLSYMKSIDTAFESQFLNFPNGIGLQEWRAAHSNGDLILSTRSAYHISESIKASLIINNLSNREYSTRPGKLNSPRSFTVRLDFNF